MDHQLKHCKGQSHRSLQGERERPVLCVKQQLSFDAHDAIGGSVRIMEMIVPPKNCQLYLSIWAPAMSADRLSANTAGFLTRRGELCAFSIE